MVRADVEAKQKQLQLPEVQDRIEQEKAEAAKLDQNKTWMTPDLMQKIAATPILRKGFMDPRRQQAMAEMQASPTEAMKKYGDVPEMREFLQAFMKLMGDHFTALADKQEKEGKKSAPPEVVLTPEQKKAQEVADKAMADPEVRAIVAEPAIQKLPRRDAGGQALRARGRSPQKPGHRAQAQKLSEAGLIGMHFER